MISGTSYCYSVFVMITHKQFQILYPNKDARAKSVRLQLGTPHIQRSTKTRQVSVVMGMTRFWLLSALSMLRAQQPPTRLVWLRLGTDSPDGSELT